MAAFGAAGMKKQIVKVPEEQVVVAFGCSQVLVLGSCLEKDVAVKEERQQLDARETIGLAQLFDTLRGSQRRQGGGDGRIANPEQGAGAR